MANVKVEELKGHYPCKIEGSFLRPCAGLSRIVEQAPSSARGKGFYLDTYMNLKTGEMSMSFIRIKLGEFQKKGIVANFCPFCGLDIRSHIVERKNAAG